MLRKLENLRISFSPFLKVKTTLMVLLIILLSSFVSYASEKALSSNKTKTTVVEVEKQPKYQEKKTVEKTVNAEVCVKTEAKSEETVNSTENTKLTGQHIQIVETPGTYTFVKVSLTDISRIVCPSYMGSPVYSKEKELEILTKGKNSYIKISPRKTENTIEYSEIPREVFIECGEEIYPLILVPQKGLPSQTIVIKNAGVDIKKASEYEKSNSYENVLLDLIRLAYLEQIPDGYRAYYVNEIVEKYNEATVSLIKQYSGSKYLVSEYLLVAQQDISLDERQFIGLQNEIVAISIVKPALKKDEQTRMFIISRNQGGSFE